MKKFSTIQKNEFNPFEVQDNTKLLLQNLNSIDNRDLRATFKNTNDPINLAFETIESAPLKSLAIDFVKESFHDIISYVSKICQ